ncbi:MAG: CopG family transcriptional regulator [Thermoleophilaceae bacterium]
MKKTSLYLDPELDRGLARRAAAQGITKAELIRRTLSAAAGGAHSRRPSAGVFDGPADLAANADRHLGETGFGRA